MTVTTPAQPDYGSDTGTTYPLHIDADFAAAWRLAMMFAPHESSPTAMTVTIDAGHVFDGTALTEVAQQTTGVIAAPGSGSRIDRIVVDHSTGVVSVIAGTPGGSPVAPTITAGKVPVAQVTIASTDITIDNTMIVDERDFSQMGQVFLKPASNLSDVASAATALANLGGLGAGSNLGTGDGLVFKDISGTTARYRSIKAGANITVTNNTNDITIAASGVGSATVGQSQLKSTTGEVSASGTARVTLPGGEYGMYPQSKGSVTAGTDGRWFINSISSGDAFGSYATYAFADCRDAPAGASVPDEFFSGTIYLQQRYVQASPPYDHGDGLVHLYVFALIEKGSGRIHSTYVAPEAPWHYNGPTDVRAHFNVRGKSYRVCQPVSLEPMPTDAAGVEKYLDRLASEKRMPMEITQAIKHADMELIPHPFPGHDPDKYDVVMLDPVCHTMERLARLHHAPGEGSIATLIHHGVLKIDNDPLRRNGPPGVPVVSMRIK
jgi:hypothetical protein